MSRPLSGKSVRIRLTQTTVKPETNSQLEAEREKTGESIGQIIDRLVKTLSGGSK